MSFGGGSTQTSEPQVAPEFRPVAQGTAQQALALQQGPGTSLTGPLVQTFAPVGTAPASPLQEFLVSQVVPSLVNPLPQLQAFNRAGQPLQPEVAALQAGDVGGRLGGGLLSLAQLQGPIAGGASVFPGLDISQLPALQAETARAFTQMPDAIRLGLPAGITLPPPAASAGGPGAPSLQQTQQIATSLMQAASDPSTPFKTRLFLRGGPKAVDDAVQAGVI